MSSILIEMTSWVLNDVSICNTVEVAFVSNRSLGRDRCFTGQAAEVQKHVRAMSLAAKDHRIPLKQQCPAATSSQVVSAAEVQKHVRAMSLAAKDHRIPLKQQCPAATSSQVVSYFQLVVLTVVLLEGRTGETVLWIRAQ